MNESTPWLSGVDRADYPAVAATERRRAATSGNRDTVGYRAHADRPRQRRDNEAPNASPRVTVRARRFELRESADSGLLTYDGYASVTEAPYEMWDYYGPYTEQVMPGAFTKTLAQVDLDVPLVLQHDALRRIARTTNGTLQLSEDEVGLHVLADQLDPKDADVAYIAPKLRSKLIDEMSFKFMITKGSWSPDWMEYHINEVDIHRGDVAIVAYGANPATAGSGLRMPLDVSQLSDQTARDLYSKLGARFGDQKPRGSVLISEQETALRVL
jgi:HK97 family phage prohead protease